VLLVMLCIIDQHKPGALRDVGRGAATLTRASLAAANLYPAA
jgi:hypothetical protein